MKRCFLGGIRRNACKPPRGWFSGQVRHGIRFFLAVLLLVGSVNKALGPAAAADADRLDAAGDVFGASDLGGLVQQWLFAFQQRHAGAKIRLLPTRLLASPSVLNGAYNGTVYVGYRLNRQAIDGFARKYGYRPTPVRIALDTIAVLVHPENPIRGMTLAQVDSVFSRSPGAR